MTGLVMNARMYAVTPEVEAAWRGVLERVTAEAGLAFEYLPYPAPQPLEDLWRRPDLGCVFMCGFPVALRLAEVRPLAAPIPSLDWAGGRPVYRSDLIVRWESPFRTLADTYGGVAGWTVEHSQSGFNAFRHRLLRDRTAERPSLFREVRGHLVTARRILDGVVDGSIDVGPLDAYWHALLARHRPELTRPVRVLESTPATTAPAFVAGPALPDEAAARLAAAFAQASSRPWFPPFGETLLLSGFAPVRREDYAVTLAWDEEARAAGFSVPA